MAQNPQRHGARPPPTNQGRAFVQHPLEAPNLEIASRIGLLDDAKPVMFRKARQVFFRDQAFTDGNIQEHILPQRSANSYQFQLVRRQMQDLQRSLQAKMWASPEVIASYFSVGNDYNHHIMLNGAPEDRPFAELTAVERGPHFAAAFNEALLAKITAPLQQAVDIRRVFEQDNGVWFDIYQELYISAAETAWATAKWDILYEGYYPPFNRSLLNANVRDGMQRFQDRPVQGTIPVLQSVFGTVVNRVAPTFNPAIVRPRNEAAWRAPW